MGDDERETSGPPGGVGVTRRDEASLDAVGGSLPVGFRVDLQREHLVIDCPRPRHGGSQMGCTAALLVVVVGGATGLAMLQGDSWVPYVLLAPFYLVTAIALAVSLGELFVRVAGLVLGVRRRLTVRGGALLVDDRPLPASFGQHIEGDDIEQLYVEPAKDRAVWTLRLLRRDGKRSTLVDGLSSREQAAYIEREIERALGIRDAPVPPEEDVAREEHGGADDPQTE
jgi:hypothetical protein